MLRLVRTCFEISALADVLVVTDYVFQKNLEELMSWQFLVGYPYPFLLYTYDSHGSGSPSYPDYIWDPKSVFYLHNINYVAHSILPSSSSYFTTPKKIIPIRSSEWFLLRNFFLWNLYAAPRWLQTSASLNLSEETWPDNWSVLSSGSLYIVLRMLWSLGLPDRYFYEKVVKYITE